jgi:hypothetical protein
MSYSNVDLTKIPLPSDGEISVGTEWRYEKAPGVGLYVQKLDRPAATVATKKCKDFSAGLKYGVFISYTIESNVMRSLTKRIIKRGFDPNWLFYVYNELLAAGFTAEDDTVYIYEDLNNCLVWTTNFENYDTIRQVLSRAIRNVASELYKKGDPVDDVNRESLHQISPFNRAMQPAAK